MTTKREAIRRRAAYARELMENEAFQVFTSEIRAEAVEAFLTSSDTSDPAVIDAHRAHMAMQAIAKRLSWAISEHERMEKASD